MKNKVGLRPEYPHRPKLEELNETNVFKLIYRSKYFICCSILYYYWMYYENDFDSINIFYFIIGFYTFWRIGLPLIFNLEIRNKNRKISDAYDKQLLNASRKYEGYLKYDQENFRQPSKISLVEVSDYEASKTAEYFKRKEDQRKAEQDRQKRLAINRQKASEASSRDNIGLSSQKKTKTFLQQNIKIDEKQPTVIKTPEELERERIKAKILALRGSNMVAPSAIKTQDNQLEVEVNNTIRNYSGICAVLAIQPIPFADIFILTPTQILMGKKIASLRGYKIKENTIESILKEISGIIGMGIIAQQLVIGAYKTVLPFFGGVTTIPVVYGLTYGIGKTIDYYVLTKLSGKIINKNDIEKIFKSSREIGQLEGKSKEKEIQGRVKK
ncbi:uncharacterized protein (DUF697 family) [Flavobacterium sp. PL11]|uniref:hypothetical protein n=1 Tax=Flavobacterium sp. PL11 TaxID=3071717 RepID=UPI002E09FB02|nr:uncharacterized protein (DUF697 family) [Flavobacterium sp. PL11]